MLAVQATELVRTIPEIVQALGGWQPVLTGFLLTLLAFVAAAWAPVLAITRMLHSHQEDRRLRERSEDQRRKDEAELSMRRQDADAKARLAEAQEYKTAMVAVANALRDHSQQLQPLGEAIIRLDGQVATLAQQQAENNGKLGRMESKTDLILDRTERLRRNGSSS